MPRSGAVACLLALLDEAYDRHSWHGPNLRGSLRGLRAPQAVWRPPRARHNAWELVVHAAYWKYAAWRRLTGEKRGSFGREGSNWLAIPTPPTEGAWRRDLDLLAECHRQLREAVSRLADADLDRLPPGSRETIGHLLRGVAAHDLYHAGQIQLLKRMMQA